ncbi:MAG: HAD family phosphatase [Candidatus Omnitrophota bacterium]|nr:HAD family phosphatase [Candidatus Omnitrophota bacterium]
MKNNVIRAIIFDFGNVLLDFDHTIAARKISRLCGKEPEEIFQLFFDSGATERFEEGRISARDFFSEVKKMLGLRIAYREFVPIWNEIFFFSEKNRGVYNLARELKKNYKMALLSNINILHFEYIKTRFAVLDAFDHVVTSYAAGCRKPKEEIYRQALKILNTPPERCFYTDDRPELIKAARNLGIRGFVFRGVAKLNRDLLNAGVRIN